MVNYAVVISCEDIDLLYENGALLYGNGPFLCDDALLYKNGAFYLIVLSYVMVLC